MPKAATARTHDHTPTPPSFASTPPPDTTDLAPRDRPPKRVGSERREGSIPSFVSVATREDRKVIDWMLEHPMEVLRERQSFLKQLQKKRCSYGREGGVLPITMTPLLLTHDQVRKVATVAETLDRVVDKVIKAYLEDEFVRTYFPYTDIPKEWIEWDPGYKKPTVLNRHDALYDGKTLKFIEFNCDNPGGRGWADTYELLYMDFPIYKPFLREFVVAPHRSIMSAQMEALLASYREFGGTKRSPRIALVSWKQFLAGSDNEIVRDFLIEHGVESNFVDAREFEIRQGKVWSNQVQFDLFDITLRFTFFKRFPREHQEFLRAIRERLACAVNPLRAAIGSQKELLSFITNEDNHHYFTDEEAETIKEHVPWTRRMDETITLAPDGTDIALLEYCLKKRDKLVLKPTDGAGGHGVSVGAATERDKWEAAVRGAIGCPWWIVQEAVNIPEYEMPVLKDNKVVLEKRCLNVNPYVFNGKYVGCLGRVSDSKVINVSSGGGIIPIFELKSQGDKSHGDKPQGDRSHVDKASGGKRSS